MKYMVISDIHGDIYNLDKVLDIYTKLKCSKLLILGDLFDYGIDLNRTFIINRLNLMADNIIAVRGNIDTNINGIMFDMPYINKINLNNIDVALTHGTIYSKDYLNNIDCKIIFIGHTHILKIEKINDKIFVNPGSISKSRSGENSFAIVDEKSITIRNLDNVVIEKYNL